MNIRSALIIILSLMGILFFFTARAHPHNWIDLRVEVRFDIGGRA
jgi:ABC-type uncharacterized transport system substrate-binding protein